MSIQPAPTDQIKADLDDLIARWQVLKVNLTDLLDGKEISEEAKYEIFHDFNVELARIDLLKSHYGEWAKRNH